MRPDGFSSRRRRRARRVSLGRARVFPSTASRPRQRPSVLPLGNHFTLGTVLQPSSSTSLSGFGVRRASSARSTCSALIHPRRARGRRRCRRTGRLAVHSDGVNDRGRDCLRHFLLAATLHWVQLEPCSETSPSLKDTQTTTGGSCRTLMSAIFWAFRIL